MHGLASSGRFPIISGALGRNADARWATREKAVHSARHGHALGRYPAVHAVSHDGFAKDQMEEAFGNSGCSDFNSVLHETPSEFRRRQEGICNCSLLVPLSRRSSIRASD